MIKAPVYLAGPMSWIPAFNFPAFDSASSLLRARGWNIVSPAELDNPEVRARAMASKDGNPNDGQYGTWGDFLARDVKIVADRVKGIILMDQWQTSRGARLEAYVGLLCEHRFFRFHAHSEEVIEVTLGQVMSGCVLSV